MTSSTYLQRSMHKTVRCASSPCAILTYEAIVWNDTLMHSNANYRRGEENHTGLAVVNNVTLTRFGITSRPRPIIQYLSVFGTRGEIKRELEA